MKGVIHLVCKCQEIENKERAQYAEAVYTLNKELTAKTTAFAEETHRRKEAEKARINLVTELATLRE